MPRQRYTLEQLRARLRERAGNNAAFWTDPELRDALNEAISVWQALTGEWTTQVTIPAVSGSPSFFEVPKQIVSLTRVGIGSAASSDNPLGGFIVMEFPMIESQADFHTMNSSWGVPIPIRFLANGGVGPYQVTWSFGDLSPDETNDGELFLHTFDPVLLGVDPFSLTPMVVTATVLDSTGDTVDIDYPFVLVDPWPILLIPGVFPP